ncbi:MAG: hypothetical protein QOG61_1166, partial [Candidatus Binataceae bacterium]|nr:hypothetical protein [Candidatus Binataceae bacterium]
LVGPIGGTISKLIKSGQPQVLALVKTPDGFKPTNALSADDTFDIVWSALRLGEVRTMKKIRRRAVGYG